MEILKIEIQDNGMLTVCIDIMALLGLIVVIGLVTYVVKKIIEKKWLKSFQFSEASIGIGNSSITVKYDKRIQEIAYKIWIELITRKIGIMFEEEHDVIIEVYNSWYSAFGIIRKLLEEIPAERIEDANGLIQVTTDVLNKGLRPHLTKWQAKYRTWYESEKCKCEGKTPQEIQRMYPEYQVLILEMKRTNEIMIKFSDELRKMVYDVC